MTAFYYPNREEMIGDDRIEKFTKEYSQRYYIGGDSGTRSSHSSGYVESVIDSLLLNGIQNKRDVLRILAWKMGKIRHGDTERAFRNEKHVDDPSKADYDKAAGEVCFVYSEDWKDAENWEKEAKASNDFNLSIEGLNLRRWNNKIEIVELVDLIVNDKERLYKEAVDNPQDVLTEIKSTNPVQLGTVYIITLLYFLSKGKYPIYDEFADRALEAILNDKAPGDEVHSASMIPEKTDKKFAEKLMDPHGGYMYYKGRIESVFGDYEKNYRFNRDIDRALWVYGHQFDPAYISYSSVWDWLQHWALDIAGRNLSDTSDIRITTQPFDDEDCDPCWQIEINLSDTRWADKPFEEVSCSQGERNLMTDMHHDWSCWKSGDIFYANAELLALEKVIEIFREWIVSDDK